MNESTTLELVGAERAVHPNVQKGRRLRWRHLWLVPGLAIAIVANQLGGANGIGILAMIAFGIAPDLPRLVGSRGRPMHDLLHRPVGAVVAVAMSAGGMVAVSGAAPLVGLVGSLVWLSHIAIGRAVGDVPRPGGSRRDA
jgi:hypothetical protein